MGYENIVYVKNFASPSKSFCESIFTGTITLKDKERGRTIVRVKNGNIQEVKSMKGEKYHHWIKYGEFEKERTEGSFSKVFRYRADTLKGKDGLCKLRTYLGRDKGQCVTFYCKGRFIWQKFIYENGKSAYFVRSNAKKAVIKHPNGSIRAVFEGEIDFRGRQSSTEPFVYFERYGYNSEDKSKGGLFSFKYYDIKGKEELYGQFKNHQRNGEWKSKEGIRYYIDGVEVSKELYFTPPEKLNPSMALNEKNTQMKAILMQRIGIKRIVEECKGSIVHKEKDMVLYSFPTLTDDRVLRVLEVVCPSTKHKYYLQTPPDIDKCEQARQWTFEVENEEFLKFKKET